VRAHALRHHFCPFWPVIFKSHGRESVHKHNNNLGKHPVDSTSQCTRIGESSTCIAHTTVHETSTRRPYLRNDQRFTSEVIQSPFSPFRLHNTFQNPHGALRNAIENARTKHQSKFPNRMFLKRKSRSIPSICAVSWDARLT